jgi:GT2 family glycosyltransferase
MAAADIAIVIVSYNVRHFLAPCLQSIRQADTEGITVEVWVVDNASVDGSATLVSNSFPEVHLIANTDNKGFSSANNQALRQIDAPFVLLLNPDTLLSEDTLQTVWQFMKDHPLAGAIGVRMIDGSGNFLPESKRQLPGLWNSFCKLFFLSELFPQSRWFSGYNLGYLPEWEEAKIDVLCGAFMFIRQEALQKVGLLDEDFFMYGEDIDLSYRISQAGYDIWYVPQTTIIHYKGESTKKSSLSYVRTFYGAMHTYVRKHYSKGNVSYLAGLINIAVTVRAAMSAASRLAVQWLAPVLDAVCIMLGLHAVTAGWANFHFQNAAYYQEAPHAILFTVYTAIWIFFLWLSGNYAEKPSLFTRSGFLLAGTVVILLGYSLLPEGLRSSRAIILLGTLAAWAITTCLSFVRSFLSDNPASASGKRVVAVVAYRPQGEKLASILAQSGVEPENMYFISPDAGNHETWYHNSLDHLPPMVKTLGMTEVVYSSENISLRNIMESMTRLDAGLVFRIGGDDRLGIIGSPARSQQGEWYGLEVRYKLSAPLALRYKRLTDIAFSVLALPMLPLLFVWVGMKSRLLKNWLLVLCGRATWVGYGGNHNDYGFLPALPPSVIKVPSAKQVLHVLPGYARNANISYAKDYHPFHDMVLLFRNLHRLANNPH